MNTTLGAIVERYSITLDDDLAAWVETQADKRGVSKAKVIRDAIDLARTSEANLGRPDAVAERVAQLERRVATLEEHLDVDPEQIRTEETTDERPTQQSASGSSATRGSGETDETDKTPADTHPPQTTETRGEPPLEALERYFESNPPRSPAAQQAIITAWNRLRKVGTARTVDLRSHVYEHHSDDYDSAQSAWQSIQRYLTDIPGIEKVGRGQWAYAGDDAVRDADN